MFWIVATIILGIVGIIALLVGLGSSDGDAKFTGFLVSGICFIIWLVATFFASVHTIGQREVGIVHDFSGTVTGHVTHGIAWTKPYEHVDKENIGIQHIDFVLDENNSAVSRDQQPIFSRLTLNYQVDPDNVEDLYKRIGPSWREILLESRMLQDFKEVTSYYSAASLTKRRRLLRSVTRNRLTKELKPYDVKVIDLFVKNLGYSADYARSIQDKNKQVQEALKQVAKVQEAKAIADQKIEAARGDKTATIRRAEGDAEAIRKTGAALRHNPEVLRLRAIEKLSEQATVIICTADRCPNFIPSPTGKG